MSGKPLQPVAGESSSRLQDILDRRIRERKGLSLERYLADRRYIGLSYADIAFELRSVTDRNVSHETLRRWCAEWGIE